MRVSDGAMRGEPRSMLAVSPSARNGRPWGACAAPPIESCAFSPYLPPMERRHFPRTATSLEAIVAFVHAFLAERRIDPDHAHDADLVIEELFTNMVKYGGGRQEIAIGLDAEPERLTIELRDAGVEEWDVTRSPEIDIDAPLEHRRPGGLGLHLVKRIAESFRYAYRDRTSIVTVTMRLNS